MMIYIKLDEIDLAAEIAEAEGKRFAKWTAYAIRRHVVTGRASVDFEKSLMRANAKKLVAYAGDGGTVDDIMARVKSYLRRYCKMAA